MFIYNIYSLVMILTVKCKLVLTNMQQDAIDQTMDAFAAACNDALAVGREKDTTSTVRIHHGCYYQIRADHGLSANLAVRAIARASGILKVKKRKNSTVHPTSIDYDARTFSFKEDDWSVSLATVNGRQRPIMLDIGNYQKELLSDKHPKSAVVWKTRQGDYYIGIHIDVEEPPVNLDEDHGWIGVDLGVVNIATLSDGTQYGNKEVRRVKDRYHKTRASAQHKGTSGTRKLLRRLSGRERRFMANVNHTLSHRIVAKAHSEGKGIRLEDLTGIRKSMWNNRWLQSWSFHELRAFIEYKSKLVGVPVEIIDPAYTSQSCPACGHQDEQNRPSQSEFECQRCQYSAHADLVGALNISTGGVINHPELSPVDAKGSIGARAAEGR